MSERQTAPVSLRSDGSRVSPKSCPQKEVYSEMTFTVKTKWFEFGITMDKAIVLALIALLHM